MAADFQMHESFDETFKVVSPPMKIISEIFQSILGPNLRLIF